MLKGLGQLGDMAKLMSQAKDMQTKMTDVQQQLENLEVEGESGGGLIKAIVNEHLLKVPAGKFSAADRAFWNKYKHWMEVKETDAWNELKNRGIDLNEGGAANAASENIDKAGFT